VLQPQFSYRYNEKPNWFQKWKIEEFELFVFGTTINHVPTVVTFVFRYRYNAFTLFGCTDEENLFCFADRCRQAPSNIDQNLGDKNVLYVTVAMTLP
jgi:hypothetical protein